MSHEKRDNFKEKREDFSRQTLPVQIYNYARVQVQQREKTNWRPFAGISVKISMYGVRMYFSMNC